MSSPRRLLISRALRADSFEKENHEGIEFTYIESKLNKNTVSLAKDYDTVVGFVNDDIYKDVINELIAQNKKAIFLRCSGFNNVSINTANKKLRIYRVPEYSPYAVAEHAFALLLTSIRRIHKAYNRTKEFNFSLEGLVGFDLHNKTIGLIGVGKIGRVMANIASGFGMNVLVYDPYSSVKPVNFKYVTLNKLLTNSDIISLHCPLTKTTEYILNDKTLKLVKKDAIIINTSRGALIDSKALLKAIKSRRIGGACLDVYEEESDIFFEDKSNHILDDEILRDLISMPNVIVTSHQAFLTSEALSNIAKTTISNIKNFYSGVPNVYNEVNKNLVVIK